MADQKIFVNPHIHHSLHTLYALSRTSRIAALCPPALIRLCLSGSYGHLYKLINYTPLQASLSFLSIFLFLLYKSRLINESLYRLLFSEIALRFVHSLPKPTLYFYQDYLNGILPFLRPDVRLISEIIIHTSPVSQNWDDSQLLFQYAHYVVVPNLNIFHSISPLCTPRLMLAPYGGSPEPQFLQRSFQPCNSSTSPSDPIIVIARAPNHRKGLDIVLEALAQLNKSIVQSSICNNVTVKIAGNIAAGPDLDLYTRYYSHIVDSNWLAISYRNYTRQAFLRLLRSADLFIMPSRHEGSSTAALEALWSGVPCLLSPACGIDSFVNGDHGFLLNPNTPEVLSEAMSDFLINQKLRQRWTYALRRDQSLFSWTSYYQKLIKLVS